MTDANTVSGTSFVQNSGETGSTEKILTILTLGGSVALCMPMTEAIKLATKDVLDHVAQNLGERVEKCTLVHEGSQVQFWSMMKDMLIADASINMRVVIGDDKQSECRPLTTQEVEPSKHMLKRRGELQQFVGATVLQSMVFIFHFSVGCLKLYCALQLQPLTTCHAWSLWYGTSAMPALFHSLVNFSILYNTCKTARSYRNQFLQSCDLGLEGGLGANWIREKAENECTVAGIQYGTTLCIGYFFDVAFAIWGSILSGMTWTSCHDQALWGVYLMVASLCSFALVAVSHWSVHRYFTAYVASLS